MTTFTLHPQVDCDYVASKVPSSLRRKTARTQTHKTVAGVLLTSTGIGWAAQGLRFEKVEDTASYWQAGRVDSDDRFHARTLVRLVRLLIDNGELVVDPGRAA